MKRIVENFSGWNKLNESQEELPVSDLQVGDRIELQFDVEYGDDILYAGDYEVVKPRGPHGVYLLSPNYTKPFRIEKRSSLPYIKMNENSNIDLSNEVSGYSPSVVLIGQPEELEDIKSSVEETLSSIDNICIISGNHLIIELEQISDVKKVIELLNL